MKAKEFVNKNIKFGDKVRITLVTGKTVDCFFGGYKTYGNVEPSLDYLLPTFYAIGKNGDMAKRSPFGPATCPRLPFSSIKDIENLIETGTSYQSKDGKPSKKFEVTLYYHTNVTVEVEAEDEKSARDAAYAEVSGEKYTQEILEGLQEDDDPDVVEITN